MMRSVDSWLVSFQEASSETAYALELLDDFGSETSADGLSKSSSRRFSRVNLCHDSPEAQACNVSNALVLARRETDELVDDDLDTMFCDLFDQSGQTITCQQARCLEKSAGRHTL